MLLHLSGDLPPRSPGRSRPRPTSRRCARSTGSTGRSLAAVLRLAAARAARLDFGQLVLLPEHGDRTDRRAAAGHAEARRLALLLAVAASRSRSACWPRSTATRWIDRLALLVAVLGQAMPTFWFALHAHHRLRGGPALAAGRRATRAWQHFVLPAIALGYYADAGADAAHARRHARRARLRLHPHRARQGLQRRARRVQARAAQRDDPGGGARGGRSSASCSAARS